jgi:hypothetical protein
MPEDTGDIDRNFYLRSRGNFASIEVVKATLSV